MLKLKRTDESKLTSWYFEIDRKLLFWTFVLIFIGCVVVFSAGSAQAARMGKPWYFFFQKAWLLYLLGIISLIFCSMLNKKQIIRLSVAGFIAMYGALLSTVAHGTKLKGSARWAHIAGFDFLPVDLLKPFFIILTAWFLAQMHETYGDNIYLNKEPWKPTLKRVNWPVYMLLFVPCVLILLKHPDLGSALLYSGVFGGMVLVAGIPWKIFWPLFGIGFTGMGVYALFCMEHVGKRAKEIWQMSQGSQVWFSVNSIRHGGLFGSGDKSYVKNVLAESANDFVYSSIAEDLGAIAACALIGLLFYVFSMLIQHACQAKDKFVVYVLAGAATLFAGQIFFNLTSALHMIINKGMTLPFISYGGASFVGFCILFGMILALVREDTWNNK